MPQRELAAAIGMSPRGLRKILNGYSGGTPTSRKAIGHAAALWASVGLKRSASIDPLDVRAAWLAEAAITTARTRCA
jgi:transcriptional regulator with XRE-family HTH domain